MLLIRDAAVIKTDKLLGSFLAVQCLGLCASTAGGMGSIPGQETNILHPTHLQAQKKRKKKKLGRKVGDTLKLKIKTIK